MDISNKYPKHFASKFSVYRNVVQVIPSPALTLIDIDTTNYDILSEYNLVTNRFIPIEAGYYLFVGQINFENAVPANTVITIQIQMNGVAYGQVTYLKAGAGVSYMQCVAVIYVTPNNFVNFYVAQNSGVNRNLLNGLDRTWFAGFRIG